MSLDEAYDANNIFAQIARGDAWRAAVYEDAEVLAFMDAFPQSEGHVLVISKTSTARNILEIEAATLGEMMFVVRRIAQAIQAVMRPDGLIIAHLKGQAAGQTIGHFHVHIIPCWSGFPITGRGPGVPANPEHLKYIARRLTAALE